MKNIHILTTSKPSRLHFTEFFEELVFTPKYEKLDGVNIYITNDEEIKDGDWFFDIVLNKSFKCESERHAFDLYHTDNTKKIILTTDQYLIKDGVQAIPDEFLEWFVKNPSCEEIEIEFDYNSYKLGKVKSRCYKIIIPKEEPKTAWVGVLHDKLNEYHPAEYELKDIYQGEGCLPHFPDEELCQIWCDSKYKEEPNYNMKQEILDEMEKQETLEEFIIKEGYPIGSQQEIWEDGVKNGVKWQQQNSYSEEDMKQFGDWCRNGLLNTEYGFEKLDKHLEQWKQLTNK
jgi:hypothetical protein